jgi:hypothetical protein
MNVLASARAYIRRGWSPVPIPEREKGPRIPGWPELRITEADAAQYFGRPCNVGIILGEASGGLVDVDLDCPEALKFASSLLPPTGARFGRASKRGSHWLYQVNGAAPSLQFEDLISGDMKHMLLELRGNGRQTVFPASLHPTGESIEWEADGAPSVIEYAALKRAVTTLAARCLVARYLPTVTNGSELLRALSGIDARVARLIRAWSELRAPAERASGEILQEPTPDYIRSRQSRGLGERSRRNLGEGEWSPAEEARLTSALSCIPADNYDTWYKIGMILQSLRWIRTDGSDIGFQVWDAWSQRSQKYPGKAELEAKWQSFGKAGRGGLGLGSLFQWAQKRGWSDNNNQSSGGTDGPAPNGDTAQSAEQSDSAGGDRTQRDSTEENTFGNKPPPRLEIISMDEVEGQNIDFLWPNRLALGKHSALAGVGGKGKSQVLYSTAAIITTGALWPCGESRAPLGSVVLLSAEDDIADMMQPRLIAAGADLKRVKAIKAVVEDSGKKKRFNLLADLDALYRACRELGDVVMVGIDPLGSYLGADLDTHRDAALRSALDPISEMASAARCSVFSVMHFNKATSMKAAMDRVMGGAGFVNAPRCALGLLVDPDDENKRVLLGLKTNIGPMPQGLRMHLEMAGAGTDQRTGLLIRATHVVWDGPTDLTADAVVAMTNERETPKLDEAIAFLQSELKDGPRPVEGVKSHATALGISAATLKRAREELGVIPRQIKGSAHGGWEYLLSS